MVFKKRKYQRVRLRCGGLDDMFGLNFTFFAARAGGTEVGPGSGTRARGVFARE